MARDPRIDQRNVSDGGTLLTNFDTSRRELYERAVKEFDPDGSAALVICDEATNNDLVPIHGNSLHCLDGGFPEGFSKFWRILERLEAESNE